MSRMFVSVNSTEIGEKGGNTGHFILTLGCVLA